MFLLNKLNVLQQRIKAAFYLLHFNRVTLIGFEILFKLLTIAIGFPLLQGMITITLKVTGYPYLTMENVKYFVRHPFTIIMVILILGIITLYTILDAGAVLYLIDRSYQRRKVTIWQTTRFTFCNIRRIFHKDNFKVFFHVMLLVPYISIGEVGIISTTVMIPNFLSSLLEKNRYIVLGGIGLLVILFWFLLKRIYVFPYFTLENKAYEEAVKKSRDLSRGKQLKDGGVLLGIQITFYLLSFVFAAVGIVLVLGFAKLFSELHLLNYVYTSAVWGLLLVVIMLVLAIETPLCTIAIMALFYLHKRSTKEIVVHSSLLVNVVHPRHRKKIFAIELGVFLVTICCVTGLIYRNATQKVNPQIEYIRTMEVTAHRGASAFYPENTMAAFAGAIELGADWIELDVQQSKDKQIFVMHDRSFFRTTGVRKMSWELDYSEIAELDAGSFFSSTFAGERIPLLSEVIDFAKENNVRLNIELKPGSQDVDIEKQVVDVILEKEFEDNCVVTSQVYECLEKVKEYDEKIQTVYVCSFAYGNVNRLTAADAFSVEAASITPTMVSRIHNAGKQIYAWTVNSRKRINRMIDLNVDNIITDRIPLAKECIYDNKTSTVVQQYVEFLREYRIKWNKQ